MRRSRFTVVWQRGGKEHRDVILAYTAACAADYFTRRGGTIVSLTHGDYRRQAAEIAARAGGGFTIDRAALAEAIELLGLKLPVQVKLNSRFGDADGIHHFAPRRGAFKKDPSRDTAADGFVHKITVKSYLTPNGAGETLWHELAHAMQAERETAGSTTMREAFDAWKHCSARRRGVTYRAKPIEVEAREHEALNTDLPLALTRRP